MTCPRCGGLMVPMDGDRGCLLCGARVYTVRPVLPDPVRAGIGYRGPSRRTASVPCAESNIYGEPCGNRIVPPSTYCSRHVSSVRAKRLPNATVCEGTVTGGGRCRHKIRPPETRCWPHRGQVDVAIAPLNHHA